MDAQLNTANQVQCPFCGATDRTIYRREVKSDHRLLNHCACGQCGQAFVFAEDKAGHLSVRRR